VDVGCELEKIADAPFRGEELGLPEVADIPEDQLQDPTFFLCGKSNKGRDGCRVPLPWTREGENFGYGDGSPAHLPQPKWYADYAVDVQDQDPNSTLGMYRTAMKLRKEMQSDETMQWKEDLQLGDQVLAFQRPGGWLTVLNGGTEPVEMPKSEVLVASGEIKGGKIPPETTVWLRVNQD
jgi:alpha-glucosidase